MSLVAGAIPAFSRIEQGGAIRPLFEGAHPCNWGPIRIVKSQVGPCSLPEGELPNHLVTLNLGAEGTCEASFASRGWQVHRTPHHGVSVYPARLPYLLREHQARDYLALEFEPDLVGSAVASEGAGGRLRPMIGERDPYATHLLLALAEDARCPPPQSFRRAANLVTALVEHLAERAVAAAPPPPVLALSSMKLRQVLEYISAHLDAPLTIRVLAGLVDMDQFRFIRAFKQSTGLSPHRYVLEARINRAKELLRNRSLSITEIALETGFATPSHFSVTFRRLVNVTPRAYRDSFP